MYRTLILLMFLICSSFPVAAANTPSLTSKDFKSEKYSNVFHLPFCPHLMSQPAPLSYLECRNLGLSPCKTCINKKIRFELESKYSKFLDQQRSKVRKTDTANEIKKIPHKKNLPTFATDIKKQKKEKPNTSLRNKYDQIADRTKMIKERKERQEGLAAKARIEARIQHEKNLSKIKKLMSQMEVNLSLNNNSGYNISASDFYVKKRIIGDLSPPINLDEIRYGYTVYCYKEGIEFNVTQEQENSSLHFYSKNLSARAIINIRGKRFNETTRKVYFTDNSLQIGLNKLNFEDTLRINLEVTNKTKNYQEIKDINIMVEGIACRLYSVSPFTLMLPLSLPPKSSHCGTYIAIPRDNSESISIKMNPLKRLLTYHDLTNQENTIKIALSAKYCSAGHLENLYPFYDEKKLNYIDLFM